MLMSIGISVEFVAHPVAAFEFAVGSRKERLAEAMRRTALPVLEGAISSFLGFAFLVAAGGVGYMIYIQQENAEDAGDGGDEGLLLPTEGEETHWG